MHKLGSVDLEQTLGALQGWRPGDRLSSHGGVSADPVIAIMVRGRLRSAADIGGARGVAAGESFLFVIEDVSREQIGSFMLYERCFGGARWLGEEEAVMDVRSSVVRVLVAPAAHG